MQNAARIFLGLLFSITLMAAHTDRFKALYSEELREISDFKMHGVLHDESAEMVRAVNLLSDAQDWVEPTPSQPQGPFYPIVFPSEIDGDLTRIGNNPEATGTVVVLQGQVMDQEGGIIKDATVEVWQANTFGKYNHQDDPNPNPIDPNFQYYASVKTDRTGKYILKTIVPGPYQADTNWVRPPHIHFMITAPGFKSLITQLYFDGNSFNGPTCQIDGRDITGRDINDYNRADLLLSRVPASQRNRLIVQFRDVLIGDQTTKLGVFNIYLKRDR